jgi:hypothetical protein
MLRTGQLLFPLIFFGVAIFCFGYTIKIRISFSNLKKTGIATLGKIINVVDDPENTYITVRFHDGVGTSHTIRSSIASSGYRKQIGKEIEVLYDPTDPTIARIVEDVFDQTVMLLSIGSVFGVIAAILTWG